MFPGVHSKTFQTVLLASLLFYVFSNPSTYKLVKKIPGFKFVMNGAKEITIR